ncbi:50S ribosomal protein L10 [Philodulcilactobacillus myokoensis]|uniref:Large ribosomal subunit protein uL10 n=1 Tax=Philodulcilactobacillus myokoensis TaxID=2929573 RepID=A0A9W6B1P8_9LACO|nr:50S ribosomal protein L10 [Philodulcilactobacillus myokoensis]GLB47171.1 50S ribosomal protein L10 [Philodulcilactobacillus myokoensis]
MQKEVLDAKKKLVDEATKDFKDSVSAIVVDYRGLNVGQVTKLRKQLRDNDVTFHVFKNNTMKRAAEAADYADLKDIFKGPTAVAFSNEDPIAPAKILKKFADATGSIKIKGGMIEKKIVPLEKIEVYATLPSREELLSTLANILQAPVRNVALAVKAVAEKGDDKDSEAK